MTSASLRKEIIKYKIIFNRKNIKNLNLKFKRVKNVIAEKNMLILLYELH